MYLCLIVLTSSLRVDLSPASPHLKRRIWQEALTTLILTTPDCAIPKKQAIEYAQARGDEYPPYLLDFSGTPGERYVENLKVMGHFHDYRHRSNLHIDSS